ncbi:hypothetical protein PG991_013167 [Apiospora marii]|uniref:Uncharacterized protein n=1 Tax=Apiospora marii TaxID=335849 RepID=A0ABR1R648_9PEZI
MEKRLASEVAVDLAVAGVALVGLPVAELAAAVVGAPVAAEVPEAEAAAVGDDDEAGREQAAAAEPVQRVPVADGDAGLVAQHAALPVGHVELELEPVRVPVRLVVVPLRQADAALVGAAGLEVLSNIDVALGRGAFVDRLLVARVVHVDTNDLVGGRGQVGPLLGVPDGALLPVGAAALGQQDVDGALAALGEDAGGHGEELLGAALLGAGHVLHGALVPVVGPPLLEDLVAVQVVPGVAHLLHVGLAAHLGVEEAGVGLDVVVVGPDIGLAGWRGLGGRGTGRRGRSTTLKTPLGSRSTEGGGEEEGGVDENGRQLHCGGCWR